MQSKIKEETALVYHPCITGRNLQGILNFLWGEREKKGMMALVEVNKIKLKIKNLNINTEKESIFHLIACVCITT
jgi:hypothetical protein